MTCWVLVTDNVWCSCRVSRDSSGHSDEPLLPFEEERTPDYRCTRTLENDSLRFNMRFLSG